MSERVQTLIAWASRNERHLGATVFVLGFVSDILTFGAFSLEVTSYIFVGYLLISGIAILCTHYLYSHTADDKAKLAKVLFPLAFQYAIGSLLSGTIIFYTRSGSVFVSWPFLLVIALVFFGNEYFRMYKERLVFQAVQFYLSLYAYVLFAVPFYTHKLTTLTFYISTGVTIVLSALFFSLLYLLGKSRLLEKFVSIMVACGIFTGVLVASYATGILPPLPLSLRELGVYHGLERVNDQFVLEGEHTEWWQRLFSQTVHVTAGETLYAYGSVFAPGMFTTNVRHVWERYDATQKKWVVASTVSFPLTGGRNGGFRGWSLVKGATPGAWRVTVETESGQVIGRVNFTVEQVSAPVPLETLYK